jgi:UDP-galactopyranose mutase
MTVSANTPLSDFPFVIVGAGFFGATLAERIATQLGMPVCVIDKRDHSGGNCHSRLDPRTGIEVHQYGTHIFHTKNERVWSYLQSFSAFTRYRHRVLTQYQGRTHVMPIGLSTINSFYGLNLKPFEVEAFLAAEKTREVFDEPRNLEEKAISLIGRPLYEAFIRGYTMKQWQKPCTELPADIITRLPVRSNYDPYYFTDPYQGMPLDGYFKIFERMLSHPKIDLRLKTDFRDIRHLIGDKTTVIYTGPIDQFFDEKFGVLEYRSLRFETEVLDYEDYQGISVMNYADPEVPYTRIHEFKHLHPERADIFNSKQTLIVREYSVGRTAPDQECYYPVNTARNQSILREYQAAAMPLKNVIFGGRLGQYRYIDMDQTIANALSTFDDITKSLSNRG